MTEGAEAHPYYISVLAIALVEYRLKAIKSGVLKHPPELYPVPSHYFQPRIRVSNTIPPWVYSTPVTP
jgi:hypothetical protein